MKEYFRSPFMDFFSLNNYDNNIIIIFTVRNFNIPFSVTNAIINQSAYNNS